MFALLRAHATSGLTSQNLFNQRNRHLGQVSDLIGH